MPNITIADGFGLGLQASLNPDSAFAKYLKQPPTLTVLQHDLASLQDVPLAQFPLKSTEIGVNFNAPAVVTSACSQLAGSTAVSANLCVVTGGKLFDPDPFASPIEIPSGRAYVQFGLKISVNPEVTASAGKTSLGFGWASAGAVSHYRSYAITSSTPLFKNALLEAVENYVIPATPDDLSALGVGDVAVIEGTGSLQVSGTFNLLTSVNPLVSVTTPVVPVTLQVQEGAAVSIGACCTITGDLQIRVQRIDSATIRLGLYRKRGADLTVQVNSSIGVTAGTSSTDFISTVLGRIGSVPLPSADELKKAGLTGEKQEAMISALKAAIQRKLELSIREELHSASEQEAVFLYEISMKDLSPEGRSALQQALQLNLSPLTEAAQSLPTGIREMQSLLTTTRKKGHALKLNILGIYNFTSMSELALKGTVLADLASGEVLITDSTTATRVSGAVNFLADSDKLRKALGQSFLITTAYRCSGLIAHAPSLKVSYWHFAEQAKTDLATMAAALNVLTSMNMITAADAQQKLTPARDFGRSSFYVNTDYDDALSEGLFLKDDGEARDREEFEWIGRKALQLILNPQKDGAYRLRALQDAVWPQVKETGGTLGNLAHLFPDLDRDSQIPIIAGDYMVIAWWSTAVARMAQGLAAAKRFFSQAPPPAKDSPEFKKVEADLWHLMTDVAANTHDRFSDPWGILAMDLASGQHPTASARIVSPSLTFSAERGQP